MKNILYVCNKDHYDWDSFLPQPHSSPEEVDIAILLLQDGRRISPVPCSHVSVLAAEGEAKEVSGSYGSISYQGFLEKIFQADLALVL
jgi:hypothetical protein